MIGILFYGMFINCLKKKEVRGKDDDWGAKLKKNKKKKPLGAVVSLSCC